MPFEKLGHICRQIIIGGIIIKTKRNFSFLFCMVLICTTVFMPLTANAQSVDSAQKIHEISSKYGIEVLDESQLPNEVKLLSEKGTIPKMSLAEFEDFAHYISQQPTESIGETIFIEAPTKTPTKSKSNTIATELYEDTYTWSRYAPFKYTGISPAVNILTWENCTVDFNYAFNAGKAYFHSSRNIESWLSGFSLGNGWTQTGSSFKASTTTYYKDTMTVKVTGSAYIGIEVGGTVIGITYPRTSWTFSLTYTY